jgi:competence protein ComEC
VKPPAGERAADAGVAGAVGAWPPAGERAADAGVAGAVALAVAAGLGAWLAAPVPLWPGLALAAAGTVWRQPVLVIVAAALVTSALGARAHAGLAPVASGPFTGVVELVTDPRPVGMAGWRAEVRLPGGQRVRASAHGPAGWALAGAAAGSRVAVDGHLRPLARRTAWSDSRHLVGVLEVHDVGARSAGNPLARTADVVRALVVAGADRLPRPAQSLYLGLVIGDDRHQTPAQQASFRVAGLTHLLAVSGQNVAFVLLAAGPLLRRLPTWPRLAATAGVLVVFAAVTRFEPSVLRATATAAVVAWSVALGRPDRGLRVTALAVAGLLAVDPLLVRSVGFQLSVAATVGILVLGPWVAPLIPGPRWLREPLTVTVSAQLAVLPLLGAVFGPVSVASVPANVAAAGAAGLVMTWGLTVGVAAGFAPEALGRLLQVPAAVSVEWIDAVATVASTAGLPRLGPLAAVPLAAALGWWRWGPVARRPAAAALAVGALLVPGPPAPAGPAGARWCPGGQDGWSVLVVDDPSRPDDLLEALLERGIRRIDVVVVTGGGRSYGTAVAALGELFALGPVLAPPGHQVRGGRRVTAPLTLPTAAGPLAVAPAGDAALVVRGPCPAGPQGQRDGRPGT